MIFKIRLEVQVILSPKANQTTPQHHNTTVNTQHTLRHFSNTASATAIIPINFRARDGPLFSLPAPGEGSIVESIIELATNGQVSEGIVNRILEPVIDLALKGEYIEYIAPTIAWTRAQLEVVPLSVQIFTLFQLQYQFHNCAESPGHTCRPNDDVDIGTSGLARPDLATKPSLEAGTVIPAGVTTIHETIASISDEEKASWTPTQLAYYAHFCNQVHHRCGNKFEDLKYNSPRTLIDFKEELEVCFWNKFPSDDEAGERGVMMVCLRTPMTLHELQARYYL